MATVTSNATTVFVATKYGEPCVDGLRRLGAKWNRDTKVWVLPVDALAKVEALIAGGAKNGDVEKKCVPTSQAVIGKTQYKGRYYYVIWSGRCKNGVDKSRLVSGDGRIDFWVNSDLVSIQRYSQPMTLAELASYAKRQLSKRGQSNGKLRMMPGCGACKARGEMCERCRFDEYDY